MPGATFLKNNITVLLAFFCNTFKAKCPVSVVKSMFCPKQMNVNLATFYNVDEMSGELL